MRHYALRRLWKQLDAAKAALAELKRLAAEVASKPPAVKRPVVTESAVNGFESK